MILSMQQLRLASLTCYTLVCTLDMPAGRRLQDDVILDGREAQTKESSCTAPWEKVSRRNQISATVSRRRPAAVRHF